MRPPAFEPRRRKDLQEELLNRARAWLADWHPRDDGDFATALLKIAARIESEVTQRLDRAPEKAFLAFLDWLGVKGKPGLAARLPVVFTMTPGSDPVDAPTRVQLQINSGETPVNFETETALRILPGALDTIVAVDPKSDAFFRPPLGISPLEAPPLVPHSWVLKSPADARATKLQLDPPAGLDAGGTLLDPAGRPYRITETQGAMVAIEPALAVALASESVMTRAEAFTPFKKTENNQQEHALYIGSAGALNVDAKATIAVQNGASIPPDATWWYSGKKSASAPVEWIPLTDIALDGADRLLKKPKGAIETMTIDGYSSRWLKAALAPGAALASAARELRLLVNCLANVLDIPPVTALEGFANTTPLVLTAGFYPFGREPHQFDAFYLGSKEAFSKPAAKAWLEFTLGARVANGRAAIGFSDTQYLTFGVSEDGRLQRAEHGVVSGKPTVAFSSPTQPAGPDQRPIALNTDAQPGAAALLGVAYISVATGGDVWLFQHAPEEWRSLGTPFIPTDGTAPRVTATMLTRSVAGLIVYAISDGKLFTRPAADGGAWSEALALPGGERIVTVAPVLKSSARAGEQEDGDGVVIVTDLKELRLRVGGPWSTVPGGPAAIDPTFTPLVVLTASGQRLCVTRDDTALKRPAAFNLGTSGAGYTAGLTLLGHTVDFSVVAGAIIVVMVARDGNTPASAYVWDAFNDLDPIAEGSTGQQLVEGPLRVGGSGPIRFFYSAGAAGEALVLPVGETQFVSAAEVTEAVLLSNDAVDWLSRPNLMVDLTPGVAPTADREVDVVQRVVRGSAPDSWVLQLSDSHDPAPGTSDVRIHEPYHGDLRNGTVDSTTSLRLKNNDMDAANGRLLYLTAANGKQRIVTIDTVAGTTPPIATLLDAVPWAAATAIQYQTIKAGDDRTARRRPLVDISGLDSSLASGLKGEALEFPDLSPASQTVTDVLTADQLAVLESAWDVMPAHASYDFVATVDLFGAWLKFEPSKPRNPTLSWEYFDGTTWRLIPGLTDSTANLERGGVVEFCVPADLQPTDVVGRTNQWVRARLVGGDYGEATVTVTQSADGKKQTVDRNLDSILAPYVATLGVKYRVCCPIVPDFVLARDNGGLIDQTNVNRNPTAVVDYFVPLATALERAAGAGPNAATSDRAIYLGFDTPVSGGPIQILFLVDEGTHEAAFPLRVDALAGGRLKPIVAKDGTRGLNESGVLELTLAESPQLAGLFGATKYWLRVRPSAAFPSTDDWQPAIRAAYLNATWATAADTQELEPLGSSDGSPRQQFVLARPPVIEGSLKLRVLERLGDEDIERLQRDGVDIRKTFPPSIPERVGCWVLWKQVVDPADEASDARVYALDDATGVITFGDGSHGMIPPIGTNVILAGEYRSGGGDRANAITAWSPINLVTPLSGVNAVVAPEGAAGGSDPQNAAETRRFAPANLRLRERALTLADFEVLALQFSRHVAQVKALPTATGMRLIVAMRGRSSKPGRADIRELRSYLLKQASPMVAADHALEITGPEEVAIRIDLALTIDTIEASGAVAKEAGLRLEKWLDPAAGGRDGTGWALGDVPTDAEIAAALADFEHVEAIETITISRVDGQSLTTFKPSQLARLAPDGVTTQMLLEQEAGA